MRDARRAYRARKAPTGARHDSCADHIPHPYPKSGWLCVIDEPGRAEAMRAFADHLVTVAAQHRAAELERPAPIVDAAARKVRASAEVRGLVSTLDGAGLVQHVCNDGTGYQAYHSADARPVRSRYLNANGQCPKCRDDRAPVPARPCTFRREDRGPAGECSGTADAPVHTAHLPGPGYDPDRNLYGATPHAYAPAPAELAYHYNWDLTGARIDDSRWIPADLYTAADHRPAAPIAPEPEPVPDPEPVKRAPRKRAHKAPPAAPARALDSADERTAAPYAVPPSGPGALAGYARSCDARVHRHRIVNGQRIGRETVCGLVIRSSLPGLFLADWAEHERYHAAQPSSVLDPSSPEPEPEPVPAPVLSIVPPADGRPRCPRCKQTFRRSGVGLAWHLDNRPDCNAAPKRAAIA